MAPEMAKPKAKAKVNPRKVGGKSSAVREKGGDNSEVRWKIPATIPEFRLILRIQSSDGEITWFKFDDVCACMNQMLKRHHKREAAAAATHTHSIGTLGDKGEEKILVASTAFYPAPSATVMYWYDTRDQSWTKFKDDDEEDNLYLTLLDKYGDCAAPVAEQNTTYWLDGGPRCHRSVSLRCYDWKSCKLYEGEFQQHFDRPEFLFHLGGDLFCLVDEQVEDYIRGRKPATQLHFILLLVSKNHSKLTLDTKLLGCYGCRLRGFHCIRYAHLLWEQSQSKESSKKGLWEQSQSNKESSKKGLWERSQSNKESSKKGLWEQSQPTNKESTSLDSEDWVAIGAPTANCVASLLACC